MNKVKLIAIITSVVLVVIAGVLLLTLGRNSVEYDLLSCNTKGMLEDYIDGNKITNYVLDEQHCSFNSLSIFGRESSAEVLFDNDAIEQISVSWELYDPIKILVANGEITEEQANTEYVHKYTQEEIESLNLSFASLKKEMENRFGIILEHYDLIPTYDGASLEDNAEHFLNGSYIREYSVRDKSGVLWFLRFEICGGIGHASLIKLIDETGYEGFIPILDMTKA